MQRLRREESMQESQPRALTIFKSDLGLFIFVTGTMARQARD